MGRNPTGTCSLNFQTTKKKYLKPVTLLHSKEPKLQTVLALLSAKGLKGYEGISPTPLPPPRLLASQSR